MQNLAEMVEAVKRRVDDNPVLADTIEWLNAGQNIMAMRVEANFPTLVNNGGALDQVPAYDEKYREIPVIYACAQFKAQDMLLRDHDMYLTQFDERVKEFANKYAVPPQYRDDRLAQQFTATAGTSTLKTFIITKPNYDPATGNLQVYIGNILQNSENITVNDDRTFTVNAFVVPVSDVMTQKTAFDGGELVTAVWEEHFDLTEPPYNWYRW